MTGFAVSAFIGVATHFGLGWALPKMATYVLSEPTVVTMQLHNVTREPRYLRLLCPYRVTFAPPYTGGGGLCLSDPTAYGLRYRTIPIWGYGNGRATRVERIGTGG